MKDNSIPLRRLAALLLMLAMLLSLAACSGGAAPAEQKTEEQPASAGQKAERRFWFPWHSWTAARRWCRTRKAGDWSGEAPREGDGSIHPPLKPETRR